MGDIEDFLQDAKTLMETPSLVVQTPVKPRVIAALYDFIFERPPTFEELRDGNTQKRWFWRLAYDIQHSKSALVHPGVKSWNQLEQAVLHWKGIVPLLDESLRSP